LRSQGGVTALVFSTSESQVLAVGSSRGEVEIWRVSNTEHDVTVLRTHSFALDSRSAIQHIALSSSRSLVAVATEGKTIHTWDVSTPSAQLKTTLHTDRNIERLSCSSDGLYLAASTTVAKEGCLVVLWDCITGECLAVLTHLYLRLRGNG